MDLNKLKEPMPFMWRVQEAKEHGANCVAYIDARAVMNRLDEVCGVGGWQSKYESHNGNLYCSIGIKVGDEWVWKTDCGSESNVEKEKGEASDALKRAAVQFGVGRFLYELPIKRLKTKQHNNKYYPVDNNGNILWSKEELTAFINGNQNNPKPATPTPTPQQQEKPWITPKQAEDAAAWMVKEGKGIDDVKKKYRISKVNEELINKKVTELKAQ